MIQYKEGLNTLLFEREFVGVETSKNINSNGNGNKPSIQIRVLVIDKQKVEK